MAAGRGKRRVAGDERSIQRLGKGKINRIIRGKIFPQFPDPRQKKLVRIPVNRHVHEIAKRQSAAPGINSPPGRIPADHSSNLDAKQMRRVQ